ncbi:MAG: DUF302 domain-containing protein [Desulfobulbaceae bacterium]|nr:DUF302 domain-containing protein [Desulfobulbaceae bacterium]
MQRDNLYSTQTEKNIQQFIGDFETIAKKSGFIIHNADTMEMANTFGLHGVVVSPDFDLHMVQICKPEKAAKSLAANPERAVLMPKYIMLFTKDGKTQIRFLRYGSDAISAIVDDPVFPASLAETYERIVAIIDEAR